MANKYQKQQQDAEAAKLAEQQATAEAQAAATAEALKQEVDAAENVTEGAVTESTTEAGTEGDQPDGESDAGDTPPADNITPTSETEGTTNANDGSNVPTTNETQTPPADAPAAGETQEPPVTVEPAKSERFGSFSAVAATHVDFLTQYAQEMDPSASVSSEKTRRNQRTLLRTVKATIALPKAEDMIAVLDEMRKLIQANRKKAFSEYYVFRDLHAVELSSEETTQFTYLMNLLLVLSDDESRKSYSKQVDLGLVTKWILDEKVRARFLAYCDRCSK